MNTRSDLLEQFERDGVVVLEGFFSRDELREVNALLDEHWRVHSPAARDNRPGFEQYKCEVLAWDPVAQNVEAFRALRDHPGLADASRQIMGGAFNHLASLVMFTLPGGVGQAWHQDCRGGDPGAYNVNRLIYTRDVDERSGMVVCVPGSHRLGDIPPGDAQGEMPGELRLCPSAGTVVFLHGRCFHRVTPNRTDQPRISVNMRVTPPGAGAEVTRFGVYRNGVYDFVEQKPVA